MIGEILGEQGIIVLILIVVLFFGGSQIPNSRGR
jgi:hypothetical protein